MDTAIWDWKSQYQPDNSSNYFDCMIAEYLLTNGQIVHSLEKTLAKYKVKNVDELAAKQKKLFEDLPDLHKLFEKTELPLVPVLWHMEQAGISLEVKKLKEIGIQIDNAIQEIESEIKKSVGFDINLNSPIQIGNYLAEKENVPLKKTKTGKYSTNETELSQFSDQFPIIKNILTFRGLAKLRSTYVDSLITKVDDTGKVHTTYSQISANTGRLASTNPNLQNIPVTSDFGQKIKSCFHAAEDHTLLSFDYSQQELRILAHITGEQKLIVAFQNKKDIHKTTASQLFDTPYEKVTKLQRSTAKTVNFGIIYGISSFGLSNGLHIPVEKAQEFIDSFYETYPKIKSFYDEYFVNAKKNGYVKTMLGRRRNTFEYPGQKFISNQMKRVLLNFPIQGSAADLMKMAMIALHEKIVMQDDDIKMLLQIHDDLVFEIKNISKSEMDALVNKIKTIMCTVYPLSVPIEVDVKVGKNWGEMDLY